MIRSSNWDFYHKGDVDQARHKQKVRQAVKQNLSNLIGEEMVIKGHDTQKVQVNIQSLHEYKIIFDDQQEQKVGMGDGSFGEGETFDKKAEQEAAGLGSGAGKHAGDEHYDQDVDIEDIEEYLFNELELPQSSEKKKRDRMLVMDVEYNDIRTRGIEANIHKKRTLLNGYKHGSTPSIRKEDVVYKTYTKIEKPESNAVIFALMDTSGSMGAWEKYMARMFYFWTKRFLETKYDNVEIVYIGHHTEARVQTAEEFFTKGESGGTICSSAFRKMDDIIQADYPPSEFNIYGFHVSDGDNLTSDNNRCLKFLRKMSPDIISFNYLEVNQYNRHSTLHNAYQNLDMHNFHEFVVTSKKEIFEALKAFFPKHV